VGSSSRVGVSSARLPAATAAPARSVRRLELPVVPAEPRQSVPFVALLHGAPPFVRRRSSGALSAHPRRAHERLMEAGNRASQPTGLATAQGRADDARMRERLRLTSEVEHSGTANALFTARVLDRGLASIRSERWPTAHESLAAVAVFGNPWLEAHGCDDRVDRATSVASLYSLAEGLELVSERSLVPPGHAVRHDRRVLGRPDSAAIEALLRPCARTPHRTRPAKRHSAMSS
jgi:hypothetical protein